MKKTVSIALDRAVNSLKEWTDPAYESSPYEDDKPQNHVYSPKKYFYLQKKFLWRM
ncbi:MAG: hypothetical protein WC489_04200 [Patescibacteria group bacterium]